MGFAESNLWELWHRVTPLLCRLRFWYLFKRKNFFVDLDHNSCLSMSSSYCNDPRSLLSGRGFKYPEIRSTWREEKTNITEGLHRSPYWVTTNEMWFHILCGRLQDVNPSLFDKPRIGETPLKFSQCKGVCEMLRNLVQTVPRVSPPVCPELSVLPDDTGHRYRLLSNSTYHPEVYLTIPHTKW